jgi:hypothetical protein
MIRFNKKIQGTRNSDDYATPKNFYEILNKEFNFDFGPCPLRSEKNGLVERWEGNVYVNPPYSNIEPFLQKGIQELRKNSCNLIVYLLPTRNDVRYWHDIIIPYCKEIRFIKGRLNFNDANKPAPFPCVLVIFNNHLAGECKISSYKSHYDIQFNK